MSLKNAEILRATRSPLCDLLTFDKEVKLSFIVKLYGKGIIDMKTKNAVKEKSGMEGADLLMDHLEFRIKQSSQIFDLILKAMKEMEVMQSIVEDIEREKQKGRSETTVLAQCTSDVHSPKDSQRMSVSKETAEVNAVLLAEKLMEDFEELLVTVTDLIKNANLESIRTRFSWLIHSEFYINSEMSQCLNELESVQTPEAALRFLVQHYFIGYLNYELLNRLFRKAVPENEGHSLALAVTEYEKKHDQFLHSLCFSKIIDLFQEHPDLAPRSPIGLPKLKVYLGETYEQKSVLEWKELVEMKFKLPPGLLVERIERNCIVVTYSIMPGLIPMLQHCLADVEFMKTLLSIDVTLKPSFTYNGVCSDIALLQKNLDILKSVVSNPQKIASELLFENFLSEESFLEIQEDVANGVDLLLGSVYEAVAYQERSVKIFASILLNHKSTAKVGMELLSQSNDDSELSLKGHDEASKPSEEEEILSKLFLNAKERMKKAKVPLENFKSFASSRFFWHESELNACSSNDEVLDVLHGYSSIDNVSYLNALCKEYQLDQLLLEVNEYEKNVAKLYKQMSLSATDKEVFMDTNSRMPLQSEKLSIGLNWDRTGHTVGDAIQLRNKLFGRLSAYVFTRELICKMDDVQIEYHVPKQMMDIVSNHFKDREDEPAGMGVAWVNIKGTMHSYIHGTGQQPQKSTPVESDEDDLKLSLSKRERQKREELEEVVRNLKLRIHSLEKQLSLERQMKGEVSTGFDESQAASLETLLEVERELRKKIAIELEQTQAQLKEHLKTKEPPVKQYKENDEKILQIKNALSERNEIIKTLREEVKRLHQRVKVLTPKPQVSREEQWKWNEKLLNAAERGVVKDVEEALSHGANTECTDRSQWTPLHIASRYGHVEVVKLLMAQGAEIDCKDESQWTPLHIASRHGHVEVVTLLLTQGAEIDSKDKVQWTPLHIASSNGHVEVIKLLLTQGAEIDSKNVSQWTPLHHASSNGHVEVVKLLLTRGAKIDSKDRSQWTPLHHSSSNGHVGVVKLLLTQGAEIDSKSVSQWTPLHHASSNGHVEVVKLLLTQGAEIDSKSVSQWTPLHHASSYGHVEVVTLLLTKGAKIDSKDENGHSPLHLALLVNHPNVAVVLISSGADIHKEDKWGQSPVLIATVLDYQEVIKHLLSQVSSDTIQKYHLPQGWKATTSVFFGYRIKYTNTNTGSIQYDHPNFSKS